MKSLGDVDPRDCRDCGGNGYGGHERDIEFCTCTAGGMAMAFHEADEKAYLKWLEEHNARKWGQ